MSIYSHLHFNRIRTKFWNTLFICICIFGISITAQSKTNIVFYPVNLDHQSDGKVSGIIEGQAVDFEYQHTYHFSSEGEKDFEANYVRFAADGEVQVELNVDAEITEAHLRTVGKDLPFTRNGDDFQFILPGPGNYYLQFPDLNTPGRTTYTVFFFIDALKQYQNYQKEFDQAVNVMERGVVSDKTLNQTQKIQDLLSPNARVYFPAGIYRTDKLTIPSDCTVYLGAGAVLKGTDDYDGSRYIHIEDSNNVRIAGLGSIDANGNVPGNQSTKGHLIDMENCNDVQLDGITFRNSNSWMLHIRRSRNVEFDNLHLFSGKDGIDPDGSTDVCIHDVTIQSIDDAFAVKSKFEGESCERVIMEDCIVFSCASSLKIGTENYYGEIRDITWDHCDAVDADRGIILYTNESGKAPIQDITWRNIRIFGYDWKAETGGAPFQFENRGGNEGGDITGILVQNVVAFPQEDVDVEQDAGIIDVTFQNVIVHGESEIEDTSHMEFNGVIWESVTSKSMPVLFIEPSSQNQSNYQVGDDLVADVQHPYGLEIQRVDWFIDGNHVGTDTTAPFVYELKDISPGEHQVMAKAIDENGFSNKTATKRVHIFTK